MFVLLKKKTNSWFFLVSPVNFQNIYDSVTVPVDSVLLLLFWCGVRETNSFVCRLFSGSTSFDIDTLNSIRNSCIQLYRIIIHSCLGILCAVCSFIFRHTRPLLLCVDFRNQKKKEPLAALYLAYPNGVNRLKSSFSSGIVFETKLLISCELAHIFSFSLSLSFTTLNAKAKLNFSIWNFLATEENAVGKFCVAKISYPPKKTETEKERATEKNKLQNLSFALAFVELFDLIQWTIGNLLILY